MSSAKTAANAPRAAHAEPMADIDDELIAALARRLRELRAYAAHSQGCSGEPCVCGLERLIGA